MMAETKLTMYKAQGMVRSPAILVYGSDVKVEQWTEKINLLNRAGFNLDACNLHYDGASKGMRIETGSMSDSTISQKSFDVEKVITVLHLKDIVRSGTETDVKLDQAELEKVLLKVGPEGDAKFTGKDGNNSVEQIIHSSETLRDLLE